MEKPCEVWNIGETENAFVISARSPVNIWLVTKTSRVTSFEIFSTMPGLESPRDSLLSWKAVYRAFILDFQEVPADDRIGVIFSSAMTRRERAA